MERHVKERLVGAAVLMAAAIILVPEMLSGPPEPKRGEAPRASGETPVKTYTIDLSKSASEQNADDAIPDTRAPPSEMPSTAGTQSADEAPQVDPESKSGETAEQPASSPPPAVSVPTPPRAEPVLAAKEPSSAGAVEPPVRAPVVTNASTPKSQGGGWAVQLGSFSSQATAERLAAEWQNEGFDAFVMPVKSNSAVLYRVRIGPTPSREQADTMLRKVKGKVPGAAVVAHR